MLEIPLAVNCISNAFNELMNARHVFFHLPDLLESLTTELAGELFLVDFTFLSVVDVFDVSCNIVTVKESLVAYFAGIISLSSVRFLQKKINKQLHSEAIAQESLTMCRSIFGLVCVRKPQTVQTTSFSSLCTNMCLLSVVSRE